MSDELTTVEESVTKVLLELMTERVMLERGMSTGIQASSTRGVAASPSTARAGSSQQVDEKRTKHRDDLANARLIPSILPTYLPPLSGDINRDSVPRDFDYDLVMTYLPKGIRTVQADQDKLVALKFSDFNLGDRKEYVMLSPNKYLMKTKGNFKDYPTVLDPEPHVVYIAECDEDSALRQTPES
jgi:hypothetical protein